MDILMKRWIKAIFVTCFMMVTCFSMTTLVSAATSLKPKYSATLYKNKVSTTVKSSLNIRKEASASSQVVGKLSKGDIATIVSRGDTWTKIQSGSVTGYAKNSYLIYGKEVFQYAKSNKFPKRVIITANSLNVRKKASKKSAVVTSVKKNKSYKIRSEKNGWAKIRANRKNGYVLKNYVNVDYYYTSATTVSEEKEEAKTNETSAQSTSSTRSQVVAYAKQFLGNPYKYGGNSLTDGVDCSGFTQQIFAHFGYSISRTSASQSEDGTAIAISEVQPGDLLFYKGSSGTISHVTMYIGNNQVIHASNEKNGILISDIGYRTPCKAVQIIR